MKDMPSLRKHVSRFHSSRPKKTTTTTTSMISSDKISSNKKRKWISPSKEANPTQILGEPEVNREKQPLPEDSNGDLTTNRYDEALENKDHSDIDPYPMNMSKNRFGRFALVR
jgi:hypothetical protein